MLSCFGIRSKKVKRQLHQPAYGSRPASRTPSPAPHSPPADTYRPLSPSPPPRPRHPPSPPVPTSPVAPTAPEPPARPLPLKPCGVCGRTFLPESLVKHSKICEMTTAKKRKTFDSSRQRREGTDLEQYLPKNFGLPENSPFKEKSPPPTAKVAPKKSVRNPIAKPAADLSKCPHCARAFGTRAFERHVEWCADKAKILPAALQAPPPQHVAEARSRLNARTQYKAPLTRSRRSLTREKNCNSRSTSVESTGVRGVSPPPPPPQHPPRNGGDYRYRSRASEHGLSAEYLDDSPHVPVIRQNKRGSGGDQAVDTARTRQARLAKDLNSTRITDDYDPFLCAARQMRELMSSDTNIPKKIQTTPKESTKTLPYLRNNKDKSPPFYSRPDYSKSMKNAINKNTQNTPTLQRMKSFGSTNSDNSCVNTFGGRASSFRVNRNEKKSSPKLNTTFTKSSKENISTLDKSPFSRTSSLNKSFSSYTGSYSTNKNKEKPISMTTSLHHSIQRTVKPPNKLEKISKTPTKKDFVNLDSILADDSSSTTDSHYIDPRLINENDNLPINVNTILNNPDIISSMESLLNTDNLPSKFETFKVQDNKYETNNNELQIDTTEQNVHITVENSTFDNKTKSTTNSFATPTIDDLSMQYDKIMTSLEQSIASKVSVRDDDSLCEDFDLEEFMTSFDEELNKQMFANEKRSYSSTTRVVKTFDRSNSNGTSEFNSISSSPKVILNGNGLIPFNKSSSMTFSSSNNMTESVFPSSVKRSTSLLDSLPKKAAQQKVDGNPKKSRAYKMEEARLEQDIMQSLKEFDKFYASEHVEDWMGNKKDPRSYGRRMSDKSGTPAKESRSMENKSKYDDEQRLSNNHSTSNGKMSNDSAYSSLNRISPSKLTLCNTKDAPLKKEHNTTPPPRGSDSSGSHKEELRAMSSDEFLALEKSAEVLDQPLDRSCSNIDKEIESYKIDLEKRVSEGRHTPSWRSRAELSSSSSESSLPAPPPLSSPHPPRSTPPPSTLRLSRFCHECGSKFNIHTAKFCTECGAKRLTV